MRILNSITNGIERKEGFTLVELSLSIAFISVLSLAVALIITNSISAYHRGLVLNQINTTGMELVDDMRASIQNAPVMSLEVLCENTFDDEKGKACGEGGVQNLVAVRKTANVKIGDIDETNVPILGAFCTGNYSYIWNSGYFFSDDKEDVYVNSSEQRAKLVYKKDNGLQGEVDDIRLLKVKDEQRAVCASYNMNSNNNEFNIFKGDYDAVLEEPVELLSENSNLALYDLYAPVPAMSRNNMYYAPSFVLGTLQGGANVMAQGSYCATPEGTENTAIENFDYCAINKFNFAAQATGGGE